LIVAHREREDFEARRRAEIREILMDIYLDTLRSRVIDPWEIEERIRNAGR
jgi:hypothetical protein